jgi:hypothetical protein
MENDTLKCFIEKLDFPFNDLNVSTSKFYIGSFFFYLSFIALIIFKLKQF